jgi:hypothetical protein
MVQKGLPGAAKQISKFGPRVRAAHVNDPNRLNPWLRGSTLKRQGGSPVSTQRQNFRWASGSAWVVISTPFAAAGDYREHRRSGRNHPHIMLQLRHVFVGRAFLRERAGQHELGLEDCPCDLHPAVERGCHPAQRRMWDLPLNICKRSSGETSGPNKSNEADASTNIGRTRRQTTRKNYCEERSSNGSMIGAFLASNMPKTN